jgi:hypothetical protein
VTNYEIICQRLYEVTGFRPEKEGGPWRCPAHDDHNPSLSLGHGRSSLVMHCFADCSANAVMTRLGLPMSLLFEDHGQRANGRNEIVATYDYADEAGQLLFQVVRYLLKVFRQRRPDGRGDWAWSTKGVRKVLYRLPEVLAAVAAGDPVFVTEGEKDADALVRAGYVATCNPGGLGKWRPEHTRALEGAKQVVVVADRDPPGRRHARSVRDQVAGVAGEVMVVEAVEGKDVSDHLAAGLSVEQLTVLGDEALDGYCAEPGEHHTDEEDEATTWEEVDLRATLEGLLNGTITRPVMTIGRRTDGVCLFYPAKINNVFGQSGKAAKTFVLDYVVLQEISAGHHVAWVDFEDDEVTVLTRLVLDMGASPVTVLTHFHYHRPQ